MAGILAGGSGPQLPKTQYYAHLRCTNCGGTGNKMLSMGEKIDSWILEAKPKCMNCGCRSLTSEVQFANGS